MNNYHTHTRYCDGKDSPEELVLEAIALGCYALQDDLYAKLLSARWAELTGTEDKLE